MSWSTADIPDQTGRTAVVTGANGGLGLETARALAETGTRIPCVSIGPVTSAEAELLGLEIAGEAETHDLEGLVRAVKLAASRAGSSPS